MSIVSSLKRLMLFVAILVAVTSTAIVLFDQLVAAPIKLSVLFAETVRTVIVVIAASLVIVLIRRSKSLIQRHVGPHPATVFQFFTVLIAVLVMIFAVLNIFQVPATTLLLGGGIVSIVIGLVISTLVGNILAGTLVLMTHPYRVGDDVLVNNIPGRILEITGMTTQIENQMGGHMVIPNTAVVQGSVIITRVSAHQPISYGRLPYALGDRVYTTYMSGEGVVREVSPFYTKILLDSGREMTFLNSSVLAGSVAVARMSSELDGQLKFSFKIDWDVDKTIRAIQECAASNPAMFKSKPTVFYAALEGSTVELEITCKVDPAKKSEAKSLILERAHFSMMDASRAHGKNGSAGQ